MEPATAEAAPGMASTNQPKIDSRALTPPTTRAQRISALLVILTLAAALLLGWALKAIVEDRTSSFDDGTIAFAYPAAWVVDQDLDGNAMVRDPGSTSKVFNSRAVVYHGQLPDTGLPGGSPLADAATAWTLKRSTALELFRNLATQEAGIVAGQPALRIDYVYVADPATELGRPGIPVVVRGSDFVLLTGDELTVIAGQSSMEDWAAFELRLAEVLGSAALAEQGGS